MSATSTTYLYVGQFSDEVKIGTSRYPERRVRRTFGAILAYKAKIPDDKAADVEAYAHDLLASSETLSEWFRCDVDKAIGAVKEAVRRLREGLSLETTHRPWLANSRRGLVKASQMRADLTKKKLRKARRLWRDPRYTVTQIAQECGLSRHTLYAYLPPRSQAREERKHGKRHA